MTEIRISSFDPSGKQVGEARRPFFDYPDLLAIPGMSRALALAVIGGEDVSLFSSASPLRRDVTLTRH